MIVSVGSLIDRPDSGSVTGPTSRRKYRVLMELGQGGTATVFLAVVHGPGGFNKLVVLKALKRSIAADPDSHRMFLAEARLSARLNHPNIVQVNEVTEQDGLPVIVMEYLEGQPLSQVVMRAGPELSLAMHLRVICDALSGLHYSHELRDYDGTPLNVVHRDMTPQNVFVTFDGVVKVLDFGIAKLAGASGDTETGVIKGKLRYMPPEQITGEPIDRRADIFATGAMIWEAAAGQRIWKDLGEATIMNRVINGDIPSPRSVRKECPDELDRICMKAMAPDRNQRYGTAAELQSDIERFLAELGEPLSSQELGGRIAAWFEDAREEARSVIERKLREESSLSLTGLEKISFPPGVDGSVRTQVSGGPRKTKGRSLLPWLVLLPVLLAGGLGAWRVTRVPEPTPAASAAPPPPPSATQPKKKTTVPVRITVFPVEASIEFDGKPVWSNPYSDELRKDDQEHTITAKSAGHVTAQRKIKLKHKVDLVIVLEPKAPPPEAEKPPEPKPVRPQVRAVRPAPPKPKPNCSPPYYVDARGVKKYKPECM